MSFDLENLSDYDLYVIKKLSIKKPNLTASNYLKNDFHLTKLNFKFYIKAFSN